MSRPKKQRVRGPEDIDANWRDRCLVLWEEDDARPPDRERGPDALTRFSGMHKNHTDPVHVLDLSEESVMFYRGGWVLGHTCEGAWLGIMFTPGQPAAEPPPAPPVPSIESAAIRDETGTVWSVPRPGRHHDVIAYMRKEGYRGSVNKQGQQGFVLTNRQFVPRRDAMAYAIAAGQVEEGETISSQLSTEDLW